MKTPAALYLLLYLISGYALAAPYDHTDLNNRVIIPRSNMQAVRRQDAQDRSSCEENELYAPAQPNGDQTRGGPGCAALWKHGVFPNALEALADDDMLRWLKVTYTDGSTMEFGKNVGPGQHNPSGRVTWDPYVDSFRTFQIAGGGYMGGMSRLFIAIKDQAMDVGSWQGGELVDVPRGDNGVLLGFDIRSGDGIDWLRPIFSKSAIEKELMSDLVLTPSFEELNEKPFKDRQMEPIRAQVSVDNSQYDQPGELYLDIWRSGEEMTKTSEVKEKGWDRGHEFTWSPKAELSWTAKVPFVGDAETKVGLDLAHKYVAMESEKTVDLHESSKTVTTSIRFRYKTNVAAGGYATCRGTALQSNVHLGFESKLTISFKDGFGYSFLVRGKFENRALSADAFYECWSQHPDEVPPPPGSDPPPTTWVPLSNVNTFGGTFCEDGRKVSDGEMSAADYFTACGNSPMAPNSAGVADNESSPEGQE